MKQEYNTVIIGSGVAGMTAAIYLKRANVDVVLIEKSAPGGQINNTGTIENYPGFSSIEGPDLAMNMFNHINSLQIEYRYGDVLDVVDHGTYKIVKTDQEELKCNNIIIATGRRPRLLGLPNEQKLAGKGISYCAICDGPLYKNKITAVVGGGNSAIDEAKYLSDICEKVYIIHRKNKFSADAVEQERLLSRTNVEIHYNSVVEKLIEENDKLKGLIVNEGDKNIELKIDGLFVYIGSVPETKFLQKLPINMVNDYLVVDEKMETNIKGIYACGDAIQKDFYQISTAIGEATTAALNIKKGIA